MDQFWFILVIAAMAILPDLLRKKRKYPKKKGPIPIPPRKDEVKRKRATIQGAPVHTEPAAEPPVVMEELPYTPHEVIREEEVVPYGSIPHRVPSAVTRITVEPAKRPAPWSTLSPEARDIYAGMVWAELLEKPLALRQKK